MGRIARRVRAGCRASTVCAVSALTLGLTALAVPASAGALVAGPASVAVPAGAHSSSPANTFVPTGSMTVRRSGATATLLGDGDVLVAGGGTASAELYHPATGTFTATGSMSAPRTDATATLLQDGDVLIAGGLGIGSKPDQNLTSAELYDPSMGTFSPTGSLNVGRAGATATLLGNGDVLVAGGACNGAGYGCDAGSFLVNLKSAELYDPSTGVWSRTGSMRYGREFQTATLLPNGEVLVAGGLNGCDDDFCTDLASAELYDPVTGKWLRAASMRVGREQQTATLLDNGDVLVAGGLNQGGGCCGAVTYASAELYDPITGRWSATGSMNHARYGQTATLLAGGWVLVAGGGSATSEIYEPDSGTWVPTGNLEVARSDQTATLLNDGDVLVAGGTGPNGEPLQTAEVYKTGAGPLVRLSATSLSLDTQTVGTTGNSLSVTVTNMGTAPLRVSGVGTSGADPSDFLARSGCGAQPVAPGGSCTVLVRFSPLSPGLRTATLLVSDDAPLSPQAVTLRGYGAGPYVWVPTGSMTSPRSDFAAVLLSDGKVLVAGGENYLDNSISTAELYDPSTGSWSPVGSLLTPTEFGAAARLPDGDVLLAGGYDVSQTGGGAGLLSSAELYDPATGTWSPTGSMDAASDGLTATLLDNGQVLVTGFDGSNPELYNPASGTWSQTGPLPVPGNYEQVAELHNGNVLLTNGPNGASALYDPSTGTWSATGSLATAHNAGSITVLPDGDVLIVGGVTDGGTGIASAEIYNPAKGTWSPTGSLPEGRWFQSAALLPDGAVVLAGGCADDCDRGGSAKSYLYEDGYWVETGSLVSSLVGQSAVVLPDGNVLLMGGDSNGSGDASTVAELYISPLVTASPRKAAVGQHVTFSGGGFYAREVVKVLLSGPAQKVVASTVTSAKGTFRVRVTVPGIPPGAYQVNAQGQTSHASAETTFVVESS